MSATLDSVGRAFLVARTPTDGYRLMLGPSEPPLRSLIVHHARPDARETVAIIRGDAAALCMVSRTHRLTAGDLSPGTGGLSPGTGGLSPGTGGADLVLDEHGRPIDVVYGFVCDAVVAEVAEADLGAARRAALDAYRVVLSGGEPVAAAVFPLTSLLGGPVAGPPPARPVVLARDGSVRRAVRHPSVAAVVAGGLTVAVVVAVIAFLALRTPAVTVPAAFVGTWTGEIASSRTGGVTLTISCAGSCEVQRGDRIGRIQLAGCEYRISVEAVEARSLITTASAEGEQAGCTAPGELRISATDQPGAVILEWDGVSPPGATVTVTRV